MQPEKIFDPSSHPYQVHITAILSELYDYFLYYQSNFIEFWKYPNHCNWAFYKAVDKETKALNLILLFPYKML